MIKNPFIPIRHHSQYSAQTTAFNAAVYPSVVHYSNTLPTPVIQAKHNKSILRQASAAAKPALSGLVQQKAAIVINHMDNGARRNLAVPPASTPGHGLQSKFNQSMSNIQIPSRYHDTLPINSMHKQGIHSKAMQQQSHLFHSLNSPVDATMNNDRSIPIPGRRGTILNNRVQAKSNPLSNQRQHLTIHSSSPIIPRRFNVGVIQFAKRFGSYARDILSSAKATPKLRRVPLIERIQHSGDLSLMNAHINLTQEMYQTPSGVLVSRLRHAHKQTGMELSKRLKLTKAALRHFEKLPNMDFVSPSGIIYDHSTTPQGDPNRLVHLLKHNEHNWHDPTFGGKTKHGIFTDPSSHIMPVTDRPNHPDMVSYMDEILELFHKGDSSVVHQLQGIRDNLIHIPGITTGYEAGQQGVQGGHQATRKTRLVLQRSHGSTSTGKKLITGFPEN